MTRGRLIRVFVFGFPLLFIAPHADSSTGLEGHEQGQEQTLADADTDLRIQFERHTLDNGMEVILHRDTTAPLVSVSIWYHVGSGDEVPGKSGFAHLFEHMMFQGAKHIGEDVHFDLLREIGGTGVNGTTNPDRTNYFEIVPSHELETALWLESDRMGYLLDLLNQQSLENQIEVVRNERRQRYDNVPYGLERFAVAAALYPEGHPYRYLTIGRHEDLERASLDDVSAFFEKWYVPSNATLVLAGDFEIAEAKALVDKWFASFPKLPKPEHVVVPAPELKANVRIEIDDAFARLERVHFVWHSPARLSKGDLELDVAAAALGSAGWGRLSKRLIDDEKVAQSVFVSQTAMGFSGTFDIVVTLTPGERERKRERIALAVTEEIDKFIASGPTKAELARHVIGVESGFVWGLEDLAGRANQLQWFNHYAGDPGYTDTYLDRLRSITTTAVQAAAGKWLSKPHVEIVSVPKPPAKDAPASGGQK
jgi:zinc protease